MKIQETNKVDSIYSNHYLYQTSHNSENKNCIDLEKTVQVDISEKGYDNYRKSLYNLVSYDTSQYDQFEEMNCIIDKFSESLDHYQMDVVGTHYGEMREIESTIIARIKETKGAYDLDDVTSAVMEAYATIFNKIMKGYEDGTREVWSTFGTGDPKDAGPRKITQEEDIAFLDQAYERCLDNIKGFIFCEQAKEIVDNIGKSGDIIERNSKRDEQYRESVYGMMKDAQEEFVKRFYNGLVDQERLTKDVFNIVKEIFSGKSFSDSDEILFR